MFSLTKKGIYSLCTAHETILAAACRRAAREGSYLLVESTSNQVDQFGGYTGLTPAAFVAFLKQIAGKQGLHASRLILGGDHLGPNRWQTEAADQAMDKAVTLVKAYVEAGYRKIHLDTSMACAGDQTNTSGLPDVKLVAQRAAQLCQAAETCSETDQKPWYVIGTDVPIPGGARDDLSQIRISRVDEVEETISLTRQAFQRLGLQSAWERVVAVVVQPGVEFSDDRVILYDPEKTIHLSGFIKAKKPMVYEAHSTDYQKKESLKKMVKDGFAILKVGPWLSYAFREVIFALAAIEKELVRHSKSLQSSDLVETIERRMIGNPIYWKNHYRGSEEEIAIKRKYSYSDRIRYYWPDKEIASSLKKLMKNFSALSIPRSMLSQYLPFQYEAVLQERCANKATALIDFGIERILDIYDFAVSKENGK